MLESEKSITVGDAVLSVAHILLRWRKFLTRLVVVTTISTLVITFFMPKWYKSSVVVVTAEKSSILGGLEGVATIFKSFSGGSLSDLTASGEYKRLLGILNSERLLWNVIEKFDLQKVYEITSYPREKTIKELISNLNFEVTDYGSLSITVFDQDPNRAAEIANYIVTLLNAINSEVTLQNSVAYKSFIEQRYNSNLEQLKIAENNLRDFQKSKGIIAVDQQVEATIKASAELYSNLALQEIQQGILERTVSSDNNELKLKNIEVSELQKKMDELRKGVASEENKMKIFIPLNSTPDLAVEYVRLLREAKIQAKILEFLTPVYEQAKMEEVRNTPSVLILDKAYPAERKAKPKLLMFGLLAFVISTLFGLFFVFVAESIEKLKKNSSFDMMTTLEAAKNDWFGLRFIKKKGS